MAVRATRCPVQCAMSKIQSQALLERCRRVVKSRVAVIVTSFLVAAGSQSPRARPGEPIAASRGSRCL